MRDNSIDVARTLCNLMVVLLHAGIVMAYTVPYPGEIMPWRILTGPIAYMAMPTLFFVSGYLAANKWTLLSYGDKLKHRIGRLLVPYILWNLIFLLIYLLTSSFLPSSAHHVQEWDLNTVLGCLVKVLHPVVQPLDAPLWYMRSLLYLMILSPILFTALKRFPKILWCGVLLGFVTVCYPHVYKYSKYTFPWYGVASFLLGAHLSLWGRDFREMLRFRSGILLAVGALLVEGIFSAFWGAEPDALVSLCRFFEIPLVLLLALWMAPWVNRNSCWKILEESSFFIYASHYLVCSLVFHVFISIAPYRWLKCVTMGVAVYIIGGSILMVAMRYTLKRVSSLICSLLDGRGVPRK